MPYKNQFKQYQTKPNRIQLKKKTQNLITKKIADEMSRNFMSSYRNRLSFEYKNIGFIA